MQNTLSTPLLLDKDQQLVIDAYRADYRGLSVRVRRGGPSRIVTLQIVALKTELENALSSKAYYFSEDNRKILHLYLMRVKALMMSILSHNHQEFLVLYRNVEKSI